MSFRQDTGRRYGQLLEQVKESYQHSCFLKLFHYVGVVCLTYAFSFLATLSVELPFALVVKISFESKSK